MKLTGLSIDGFGVFNKVTIEHLPPGLVLFQGNNEAGKSTLLDFIRTILFGFPRGNSKQRVAPPLAGGLHGGRLFLHPSQTNSKKSNPWILKRHNGPNGGPVTITLPDGSTSGGDALHQILGQATKELLHNIFAFGLGELQDFDTLRSESVQDAIYGASAGVALKVLPKIKGAFQSKRDALFKPRGANPSINLDFEELPRIRERLRAAKGMQDRFVELVNRIGKTNQEIDESETGIKNLRRALSESETWLKCWDDWSTLQNTVRELEAVSEAIIQFPESGLERLQRILDKREERLELHRNLNGEFSRTKSQHDNILVDAEVLKQAQRISTLRDQRERYTEALEKSPRLQQNLATCISDNETQLKRIGEDWDLQRLQKTDRSLFILEELTAHERSLQDTEASHVRASDSFKTYQQACAQVKREATDAHKAVEAFGDIPARAAPDTIRFLQSTQASFTDASKDHPTVKKDQEQLKKKITEELNKIEPSWKEEHLKTFDTSVPAKERVQSFEKRFERLDRECAHTDQSLRTANEELKEAKHSLLILEQALKAEPEPTKEEAPAVRKVAINSLRRHFDEQERRHMETAHRKQRLYDKREEIARLQEPLENYATGLEHDAAKVLIGFGFIFGGGAAFGLDDIRLGAIIFATLVGVGIMLLAMKKLRRAPNEPVGGAETIQTVQIQITELEKALAKAQDDEKRSFAHSQELAEALGLKTEPTPNDLNWLEEDLEEKVKKQEKRERMVEEIQAIQTQIGKKEERVSDHTHTALKWGKELEQVRKLWNECLTENNLNEGTRPRTVDMIFVKVEELRKSQTAVEAFQKRLDSMAEVQDAYRKQVDALKDCVKFLKTKQAISEVPYEEVLVAVNRFLEEQTGNEEKRNALEAAQQLFGNVKKRLQDAETDVKKATSDQEGAKNDCSQEKTKWREWLTARGFSPELSPETAREALQVLEQAFKALGQQEKIQAEIKEEENKVDGFREDANQLFLDLNRNIPAGNDVLSSVTKLIQELETHRTMHSRMEESTKHVGSLEGRLNEAQAALNECEQQRQDLFLEADVENEERFRERGRQNEQYQKQITAKAQAEHNLTKISGTSDLGQIAKELNTQTPQQLKAENAKRLEDLETLEATLRTLQQTLASLKTEHEQLSSSEDVIRIRMEEESLKEKIQASAIEYARYQVALHLLEEARLVFEREQQPKVLKEAAEFFREMTGDSYTEIRSVFGEKDLQVIAKDGTVRTPMELSRGTAEQLYLSVRFGYIRNFIQTGEPLPVIMDDILVNFDPDRAKRAAQALLKLAKTNQVLFFTCHPGTVERFRSIQPDLPLFKIEGHDIKQVHKEKAKA